MHTHKYKYTIWGTCAYSCQVFSGMEDLLPQQAHSHHPSETMMPSMADLGVSTQALDAIASTCPIIMKRQIQINGLTRDCLLITTEKYAARVEIHSDTDKASGHSNYSFAM